MVTPSLGALSQPVDRLDCDPPVFGADIAELDQQGWWLNQNYHHFLA